MNRIVIVPAGVAQPGPADIEAFCIAPDRFIELGLGSSHAGHNTADYPNRPLDALLVFAP
jgi:hypothetical protein